MIDPKTFRNQYEDATLEEIIKERDKLIREIRRYEKGKIPKEDYDGSESRSRLLL